MTSVRVDMSIERKLITLLVMNDLFISKLRPILNPIYLNTNYAKEVAEWCIEYYDKYEKAPGPVIQDIFVAKREYITDTELTKSIGEFLERTLAEYDETLETNLQYYVTASETHLRRNSLTRLKDKLDAVLSSGDADKGEQLVATYKRISVPANEGVSIIDDHSIIREAFTSEQEVAFRFPGALGTVVGNCYRGDLIGWMAPFKAGKTWSLMYTAEQAMLAGNRVLVVSLEMRMNQLIKRAWQALNGLPIVGGAYTVPYFYDNEDETFTVMTKTVEKEGLDLADIERIQKRLKMQSRGGNVRYMISPSKTTTVQTLEAMLDNLMYYEGFATDVLIVDYADILGASRDIKTNEYRHQMDDIWSNLRRVAQERNICIATASQTNRGGMEQEELTAQNLAEDIRKAAHVSKLIGLSRTKKDKEKGTARVNILFERDEQETYDSAIVLQQYQFGRFCMDSRLACTITGD